MSTNIAQARLVREVLSVDSLVHDRARERVDGLARKLEIVTIHAAASVVHLDGRLKRGVEHVVQDWKHCRCLDSNSKQAKVGVRDV